MLLAPAHRLGSRSTSSSTSGSSLGGSGTNQFHSSRPPLAVHAGSGSGGMFGPGSGAGDRGSGSSSSASGGTGSPMLLSMYPRSISAASPHSYLLHRERLEGPGGHRYSVDAGPASGSLRYSGEGPASGSLRYSGEGPLSGGGTGGSSININRRSFENGPSAPTSAVSGPAGSSGKRGGSDGLPGSGNSAHAMSAAAAAASIGAPRPSPPLHSPSGGSMNLRRQLMSQAGYSASAAAAAAEAAKMQNRPPRRVSLQPNETGASGAVGAGGGTMNETDSTTPSSTSSPLSSARAAALASPLASPPPAGVVSSAGAVLSSSPSSGSHSLGLPVGASFAMVDPLGAPAGGASATTSSSPPGVSLGESVAAAGGSGRPLHLHARQRSRGAINVATLMASAPRLSGSPTHGAIGGVGGGTPPGPGGVDNSLLSAIRVQQEQLAAALGTSSPSALAAGRSLARASSLAAAAETAATASSAAPIQAHAQPTDAITPISEAERSSAAAAPVEPVIRVEPAAPEAEREPSPSGSPLQL